MTPVTPPPTRRSPRERRRTWLFRCAVVAAAACGGVIAVELTLRLCTQSGRYWPHHRNSTRRTFLPTPHVNGIDGESWFTTNSFGCRGPEPNGERHRLLTIGGSTTACTWLDDSEAWPQVVMDLVNAAKGDPRFLWVTNSGIDGKSAPHHLMHVEYLLPRLPRIDVVVVYCGINDVGRWLYHAQFTPDRPDDPVWRRNAVAEAFRVSDHLADGEPFWKGFEIWRQASAIKDRRLSRQARSRREQGVIVEDERMDWLAEVRHWRHVEEHGYVPEAKMRTMPVAREQYADNLRRIAARIRAHGARPVFVAQAIRWSNLDDEERCRLWMGAMDGGTRYVEEEQMQRLVDSWNECMREVAAAEDVGFVDLPAALAGFDGKTLFCDGCHFTEAGAHAAARVIADWLLANVWPAREPSVELRAVDTAARAMRGER